MTKRISTLLLPAVGLFTLIAILASTLPAVAQSEGQIGGIVYNDKNANGVREQGEEGIQDVEVTFESAGWNTTINSASNGAFSISLNPATWTVSVKPPAGYKAPKSSQQVSIAKAGDAVTNVEFGLVALKAGEVLPAGGAPISGTLIIGGLAGVLLLGLGLVAYGQYRSKQQGI
jgi:hypothetical protein